MSLIETHTVLLTHKHITQNKMFTAAALVQHYIQHNAVYVSTILPC